MELKWQEFIKLPNIAKLSLNEQVKQYSFYLDELSNLIHQQNKGKKDIPPIPAFSGFLTQENDFYILQENGSKIYL